MNCKGIILTILSLKMVCGRVPIYDTNNNTLIFTQVIFRHGDRTPNKPDFPSSPIQTVWPEGLGELTEIGKEQHRQLGQWLSARYKNSLISDTYDAKEVYVQSSNLHRTIQSAKANLEGLYPFDADNIPINSISVFQDDYLIGPKTINCPKYTNAFNDYINSPEYKTFEDELQPYFDNLTILSGMNVNDPHSIIGVHDIMVVKSAHNKTLETWTKDFYPNNDEFNNLVIKSFEVITATPIMTKLSGGFLLKDILDRATEKQFYPNRKLWIYSTHDSTLVRLLKTVGNFDSQFVQYSASLMVETHMYNNVLHIELYYRNPTDVVQLEIPNCGLSCPLHVMYQLYADFLPEVHHSIECAV